jgi:hypothetical protein
MILLPLGLTTFDFIGADLLSREYAMPRARVLQSMGLSHFSASAFVFLCGVSLRAVMAKELRVPRLWAAIALFAAIARLSVAPQETHELSHALFDSCGGYDDMFVTLGIGILVSAATVLASAWRKQQSRSAQASGARAGTTIP